MTITAPDRVVDAEIVRTADEWAEIIRDNLGRAVESIVAAGRNLIAAKADLSHGEWMPMLASAGINDREARRLMEIGRSGGIKSAKFADLPASPTALLELSRLAPEAIE